MINELYELSKAMEQTDINAQSWHRKYKPIPNIKEKAPCVRIMILGGQVVGLSEIGKELGAALRKYGTNQGSFPCMNLAPLYRITDEAIKKEISEISPENWMPDHLEKIKDWCRENNWGNKFKKKYEISMHKTPEELEKLVDTKFQALSVLINESNLFLKPEHLHQELERAAFEMLSRKEDVKLALTVLFYTGNPDKNPNDDTGTLSVAFDSPQLVEMGMPAISAKFVKELNQALLSADPSEQESSDSNIIDAFGFTFSPIEEPMPEVKLAGGFDVKLRTMFKEQHCQTRYGRIENASYPISPKIRKDLQTALEWLGTSSRKEINWINTDKNEILFAYPSQQLDVAVSFTQMFKRPANKDTSFETQAKLFITELKRTRKPGSESYAERIQIFILRKIDKARTKVVYTRQTNPFELEACSESWTIGCANNLPHFPFGQPKAPFPLDAADILNRVWKQNGELATDRFKPFPKYHGLELLLEPDVGTQRDLHMLVQGATALSACLGRYIVEGGQRPIWWRIKDMLALMGLMLYRAGIRKEKYMKNFPYLYGQLLRVSDELHALYCNAVRGGNLPTNLAGGSLYQSATEAPIRTLNLLGQRMNPYIIWAKSYRTKGIETENIESWRAGWLLSLYEKIATQLFEVWSAETRFSDVEKAQLFIGYLAAFPKKEESEAAHDTLKENEQEEQKNEQSN